MELDGPDSIAIERWRLEPRRRRSALYRPLSLRSMTRPVGSYSLEQVDLVAIVEGSGTKDWKVVVLLGWLSDEE